MPPAGTFGNAGRNMIIGPGSSLLNAQFSRDLRMHATRVLTMQLNATNLLNTVNYGAVDTVVNSPTFGQVLSVRGDALDAAEFAVPVLNSCQLDCTALRHGPSVHVPFTTSPSSSSSSRLSSAARTARRRRSSAPVFRSGRDVISVDVVVRDKPARSSAA